MFFASNGVGLGHLTRTMAVARRLPAHLTPVIFTNSQAIQSVRGQGFFTEYLGGSSYSDLSKPEWDRSLAQRLGQLLDEYEPSVVVLDTVTPHHGLTMAIERRDGPPFVWCRRGMWKRGVGARSMAASALFDVVVEPGDLAAEVDVGLTAQDRRAIRVPPVLFATEDEVMTREEACEALGLAPDACNVLLQLGAGNVNDTTAIAKLCSERLSTRRGVRLVVAESTIAAQRGRLPDDITRVTAYPLSPLLRAFDFGITACGYNTFHEVLRYGPPPLLVPNRQTALDDQAARATWAERAGVARAWTDGTAPLLDRGLAELLDPEMRARMAVRARELPWGDGAEAIAGLVTDLAAGRPVPETSPRPL